MAGRVEGKVAFVTGVAMSQGRSHALRLAQEGAAIIGIDACARIHPEFTYPHGTEEKLAETKALIEAAGGKCLTAVADVRDVDAMQAAVDEGVSAFGPVNVVVANAGVHKLHRHSWEIAGDVWDAMMDVNAKGVFNTFKVTVPTMIEAKRGGSVITTSSSDGLRGYTNHMHYTASKWAVVGMTKAFAVELAPYRIRVNSVAPCGVRGEGIATLQGTDPALLDDPRVRAAWRTLQPNLDEPYDETAEPVTSIDAREISEAVLWLASDEARYVTAQVLAVDNGNTNTP